MNINPYDYMLELKNNKILFSYMTECFITKCLDDDDINSPEWTIGSKSSEGEMTIYPLINDLFRLSLPIPCPHFLSPPMTADILIGLQPTIQGLITFNYEKSLMSFDYNLTYDPLNKQSLDKALLLFLRERGEIKNGFKYLIEDFNKHNKSINNPNNLPNSSVEQNLSSLWDVMEDIDNLEDDGEDLDS